MKLNSVLKGAAAVFVLAASIASARTPPLADSAERVMMVAKKAQLAGEIALADSDGAVIDKVLGLADRESARKHVVGAPWLWASVTKQVTAILVMQHVEVGTLSLHKSIKDYLPEFSGPSGDRVTLLQLLQHMSGLPNPNATAPDPDGVPAFYREAGAGISEAARASKFCASKPRSEPGAGFAYNNCDYLVLGAILERVTDKTYAELVADRIAKPSGLGSLKVASDSVSQGDHYAVGYSSKGVRYPPINVATFGAAGALVGTASDLALFDRALVTGKFLKAESRKVLWESDPKLGYQALGVWTFPASLAGCKTPVALVERRGDVGGIQVRNVIAPDLGRSIAIFTNDDTVDFGEVWQAKGLSYDLLSAALCPSAG